jgi:hypothetical protein
VCVCASALRFFSFSLRVCFYFEKRPRLLLDGKHTATATTSPDRFQLLNGSVVMEATHIYFTSFFCVLTSLPTAVALIQQISVQPKKKGKKVRRVPSRMIRATQSYKKERED